MLPKQERLLEETDFKKLFKFKCSIATPNLVAYVVLNKQPDNNELPKVGFVVGKKVDKRSTKRNKIKRHLRESYKLIRKTYPEIVKPFTLIVFIAKPSMQDKNYMQVYQDVNTCLKKAQKFIKKTLC